MKPRDARDFAVYRARVYIAQARHFRQRAYPRIDAFAVWLLHCAAKARREAAAARAIQQRELFT